MGTGGIHEVNPELGDEVSKMLYQASLQTYDNRPGLLEDVGGSFSGFKGVPLWKLPTNEVYEVLGFDGVGTKVEIAERLEDHTTIAFDLFAMVCDDAVVRGGESYTIGSVLDVSQLAYKIGEEDDTEANERVRKAITELSIGYIAAAQAAGVVVVNGETAELGSRVAGFSAIRGLNYNWAAASVSYVPRHGALTGDQLKPGQVIVGFEEEGFRSNGMTDVRIAFDKKYGEDWHNVVVPELGEKSLGQLVLHPSTIYSKIITKITGGIDPNAERLAEIFGVAHITGGGPVGKIGRMLRGTELGAVIEDPIAPPAVMLHAQEAAGMSDEKAYTRWHMGSGMIAVTNEQGVDVIVETARQAGVLAKPIGHITTRGVLQIKNMGVNQTSQTSLLSYDLAAQAW